MWMFEGIWNIIGCPNESIGGGELWHWRIVREKSKVSTMRLLAVDFMYKF
jgi:hypothetical protein